MKTATLIRHTRVEIAPGLCYGRTDVPLAATFATEAAAVRAQLRAAPRLVWTSPATRCRRLAEALGAGEVRIDDRLQELNFGAWENRRWDDIPRTEIDAWARDFVEAGPPGGESLRALQERVVAFQREWAEHEVTVVTHAGVMRGWLCLTEGRPLAAAFERAFAFGECVSACPGSAATVNR